MLDIDGTLVESFEFDEDCYLDAVHKVLGQKIDSDWSKYEHVTDTGLLYKHIELNGLCNQKIEIHTEVKSVFTNNIRKHINQSPVQAVSGALTFVKRLKQMPNVSLSIATGGWAETAQMKLNSAGFDISGIPMASSNDHYSRKEIMKIALVKSKVSDIEKVTYFGDAEWDKRACKELNFNFVLVGNRFQHNQSISNFKLFEQACNYIGL